MHLRRFTAENISKALEMVKAELGSEAIILSTEKKRKKDPESRCFVSYTEVVAAVDREAAASKSPGPQAETRKPPKRVQTAKTYEHVENLASEVSEIKKELANMARLLERLMERDERKDALSATRTPVEKKGSVVKGMLLDLKLDAETAESLSHTILSSFSHHQITRDHLISWMKNYMTKRFRQAPAAENCHGPVWWAFIGPTGVGKTTTLAKIAARLKFLKKRRGVLISVDSYRLGAIQQLRRYAGLMDLPLETAQTTKDLLRIFSCHRDKDFILLDTTGRNPFSSSHKTELQRLFDAVPGLMAQVMLCSTYKREDLMESINFYNTFPVAGWTLTKTDETRSLSATLFSVLQAGIPLSYMTNGQRVPEDIQIPRIQDLCTTLFDQSGFKMKASGEISGHLNATVC
jgi:flagellar biosynthesis protein FlhF